MSNESRVRTPSRHIDPDDAAVISEYSRYNTLDVIVNPAAANGRAGKRWPEINNALAAHGFETLAHFTTRPGDATEMARRLARDGAATIVCVGGDGTVNEVVNGLIEDDCLVNPDTRLALIPAGTGKDLCRALGVPTIENALHAIDGGVTATIDVGRISYIDQRTGEPAVRYFANCADGGLGAEAAAKINSSSKALGSTVTYFSGAVRAIVGFSFRDATFEVDGAQLFSGRSGIAVFANGPTFAGGMRIAPDASLCDGLLEIFVLQDVGKRELLFSLLPRVYGGRHVGRPGVLHTTGTHATVTSPGGMRVEVDGEQVGGTPLDVRIVPRVLRVIGHESALARMSSCIETTS